MQLRSETVTIAVDDATEMNIHVSHPASAGPHPGILVLQEAMGVNNQTRGLADRYALLGFVAVAPDPARRTRGLRRNMK